MATLSTRYEVLVIAHYTSEEIEAGSGQEAEDKATHEFYDNAYRASIEDTRVNDEWLVCDDCNEERVEYDHECDEESDVSVEDYY